ncbi:hypothetical protein VII00023_10914 [Vibrio ichthyoenteri ATCC 700023]|uniref:Uncharacterized protein n=1 Tax=Vibrio ichthyoenteri ATCC 700023 TaxID=870968 RepID=F9S838_9VIBR|nr:hypothetical protein VII00023_10914 [Vibrio ichthyoenteri ATCC 700023]
MSGMGKSDALSIATCQTGMGVVVLKNHAHYTETIRFVAAFYCVFNK